MGGGACVGWLRVGAVSGWLLLLVQWLKALYVHDLEFRGHIKYQPHAVSVPFSNLHILNMSVMCSCYF